MKALGIVRKVDALGRVVLPSEFRKMLDIKTGDDAEMFASNGMIIVKKYKSGCMFCGRENKLIIYKRCMVCIDCISILQSMKTGNEL